MLFVNLDQNYLNLKKYDYVMNDKIHDKIEITNDASKNMFFHQIVSNYLLWRNCFFIFAKSDLWLNVIFDASLN